MAKVTGVGPTIGNAFVHARRRNLMTAHRVQEPERGAWHVAVVATTAGGVRSMVGVLADFHCHCFVTLQTGLIGIHLRFQLAVSRPRFQARATRGIEMHFVTRNAGEFAPAKTGGGLHAVEFAAGHANHSIAPKAVAEKIGFGAVNKILLLAVIRRVWLNHESLFEVARARPRSGAMLVEVDLVGSVVEGPDAVTLAAVEPGIRPVEARRIDHSRIGFSREMNFETTDRIAVALDVFAAFAVAGFARDPKFRDLRIPLVALHETRLALGDVAIHAGPIPRAD